MKLQDILNSKREMWPDCAVILIALRTDTRDVYVTLPSVLISHPSLNKGFLLLDRRPAYMVAAVPS